MTSLLTDPALTEGLILSWRKNQGKVRARSAAAGRHAPTFSCVTAHAWQAKQIVPLSSSCLKPLLSCWEHKQFEKFRQSAKTQKTLKIN